MEKTCRKNTNNSLYSADFCAEMRRRRRSNIVLRLSEPPKKKLQSIHAAADAPKNVYSRRRTKVDRRTPLT